jgi:hypothetical protein
LEANIPRELDAIVLSCLEKDPENRVQSGAAMEELLSALRLANGHVVVGRGLGTETLAGFGGGDITLEGLPSELTIVEDEGRSTDVFANRYDLQLRRVMRKLAESICDGGCSEPALLVVLAEANQVEQELSELREELSYLNRSDQLVAQKGREREASLRFALGELKFERSKKGVDKERDAAIESLAYRLADVAEQTRVHHNSIIDKQINRTAEQAHKLEELRDIDERLNALVERFADGMRDNPQIASLMDERGRLRDLIEFEG